MELEWLGAIFNIGWLGYRKYYVPAALFMLLLVACDAFSYYMGFNVALPIINMVPLTFLLLILFCLEWGFLQMDCTINLRKDVYTE